MTSVTGLPHYDQLAINVVQDFRRFVGALRSNGWIVKATDKLPKDIVAQFFPRKRRFYYDPRRFTVLDMMHEWKYLEAFVRRGNWKTRAGQVWRDEIEAYSFEREPGTTAGFSAEYMDFLSSKISYYGERLAECGFSAS